MENIISLLKNTLHLKVSKKEKELNYSKSIPFVIKKSYNISIVQIENIDNVVLSTKEEDIKSIKKHLSLFEEALSLPIILNISHISNSMKKYLIENKISFISAESIYLPRLLIYLNDISNKPKKKNNTRLSKLAQIILISELIKKEEKIEIFNIANSFNVTQMSASRALKELYEFKYLKLETIGRKKIYTLDINEDIEEILSTLKNPKIKDVYIKNDDLKYFDYKILSSYSALPKYTNITNNENIYAVEKEYFEKQINKNKQIQIYDNKYDNTLVQIELWRYSPLLIQDDIIDPISLYLLLKNKIDEEDTRVRNAMDELYNQIKGMI
jgi:DNA-binding transcriptional ArsR family regulator